MQEKALVKSAIGASRTIILGTDVIESSAPCFDLGLARAGWELVFEIAMPL